VKPIEFYNLGVAAASTVASEAERRTVVSRIYYGLHHEACCRFFRVNGPPYLQREGSRHLGLVQEYRKPRGSSAAVRVGNLLDQLRRLRTTADYDLAGMTFDRKPINDNQLLAVAVKHGELLLKALEQYSPGEAADGCQCVAQ
jgi:hypothetical protein